jgi:pimeloyl-ACP methyl ester carboxylesterase
VSAGPRPALGDARLLRQGRVRTGYTVRGSGETVVLLPALGRAASDYDPLVETLNAARYRSVAVDLRGMGRSAGPAWARLTLHDFARDVAQVVQEEVRGRPVHVIGRALGNRVARALAADHPALVRSVVLLGAGGHVEPPRRLMLRYALLCSRWSPRTVRRRVMEETLCAPGNRLPDGLDYPAPVRALWQQARAARRTRREDWWSGGSAPILVIQGADDRVAPPANALRLREEFPERVTVEIVPRAGHALLPEQPERVSSAILAFLRKHPVG